MVCLLLDGSGGDEGSFDCSRGDAGFFFELGGDGG